MLSATGFETQDKNKRILKNAKRVMTMLIIVLGNVLGNATARRPFEQNGRQKKRKPKNENSTNDDLENLHPNRNVNYFSVLKIISH